MPNILCSALIHHEKMCQKESKYVYPNCNFIGDCFASLGYAFLCILFPKKKFPLFAVFLFPSPP